MPLLLFVSERRRRCWITVVIVVEFLFFLAHHPPASYQILGFAPPSSARNTPSSSSSCSSIWSPTTTTITLSCTSSSLLGRRRINDGVLPHIRVFPSSPRTRTFPTTNVIELSAQRRSASASASSSPGSSSYDYEENDYYYEEEEEVEEEYDDFDHSEVDEKGMFDEDDYWDEQQEEETRTVKKSYYYYDDDDDVNNNNNNNETEEENNNNSQTSSKPTTTRGGMYKVVFDPSNEIDPKELQLDWEVCVDADNKNEALVLLPPEAVERPTAILHFVGGTFFGSLPKVWYRSLLEGLVRNTQCAVVVTPIPVTLLKSPLQHIALSRKLQSAFENAWTTVLEDEYGDLLNGIPLCGCGHSLGARLLVVMTTLTQNKAPTTATSSSRRRRKSSPVSSIPPYRSFVLISFTNYGAAAGIPGVSTLLRQSKKQETISQTRRDRSRRKNARKAREDWWIDGVNDNDGNNNNYSNEDEDDGQWEELVEDLQELLQEQAARVKSALTPNSKDLEFSPTPDMLWKALEKDGRYSVPKTLIVQFDDDAIDQSSKLAQILHDTNSSDVHFARLRGVHLTPISVDEEGTNGDTASSSSSSGWLGLSSRTTMAVWKAIKGRGKTRAQETAMRDLRRSISRYISDVVTK